MSSPQRITVLLADDHMIVRQGLRNLLELEPDIEVIGEAATGREAVAMAGQLHPAVVVMDIAMPLLNGVEATRQIRRADPKARVLILSAHNDDAYVEHVTEVGAMGYLLKQTSSHILAESIREVVKGKTIFSPAIAKKLRHKREMRLDRNGRTKVQEAHLSTREVEVLQLIAEGSANKQIAAELGISVKTVEKHRDHLMRKLDIHDTAGITRYAIEVGIIECSVQLTIV